MLSFNHYAYGAVIDWVYRHVAGLAPGPAAARATGTSSSRPGPLAGHRLGARLGRDRLRARGDRLAGRRRRQLRGRRRAARSGRRRRSWRRPTADSAGHARRAARPPSAWQLGPGRHTLVVTQPRLSRAWRRSRRPARPLAATEARSQAPRAGRRSPAVRASGRCPRRDAIARRRLVARRHRGRGSRHGRPAD